MEPQKKPGERTFDVIAGGKQIVHNLDIAAEAGGTVTAIRRNAAVEVTEGELVLGFVPGIGDAIVSAIEITREFGDCFP